MNASIESQLRRYTEIFEAELRELDVQAAVDEGETGTPPVRVLGPRRGRRARPWLVAAAGAFATLLVVGGVTVLSRDSGEEPAATDQRPADAAVTWVRVQWEEGQGPWVYNIVATESGFLGTDRAGHLWQSPNGGEWEPMFPELSGVDVVATRSVYLVAGRRDDGTRALLRSTDGAAWSEIDSSSLPAQIDGGVVATTPSGLTEFGSRSGPSVLAVVAGDRLVDVHSPPWNAEGCCPADQMFEIGGTVVAYQLDFGPATHRAWRYLGDGVWSAPADSPIGAHAQVGDTLLTFDGANGTCCDNPIEGTSYWPLLASSDGINWSEVDTIAADDVSGMHVDGGSSFWVYGANIRGGGPGIEANAHSPIIWISLNGLDWQPIDLSFGLDTGTSSIWVAGDALFLFGDAAYPEWPADYWLGIVEFG